VAATMLAWVGFAAGCTCPGVFSGGWAGAGGGATALGGIEGFAVSVPVAPLLPLPEGLRATPNILPLAAAPPCGTNTLVVGAPGAAVTAALGAEAGAVFPAGGAALAGACLLSPPETTPAAGNAGAPVLLAGAGAAPVPLSLGRRLGPPKVRAPPTAAAPLHPLREVELRMAARADPAAGMPLGPDGEGFWGTAGAARPELQAR
jgi:hypothetical protein